MAIRVSIRLSEQDSQRVELIRRYLADQRQTGETISDTTVIRWALARAASVVQMGVAFMPATDGQR